MDLALAVESDGFDDVDRLEQMFLQSAERNCSKAD